MNRSHASSPARRWPPRRRLVRPSPASAAFGSRASLPFGGRRSAAIRCGRRGACGSVLVVLFAGARRRGWGRACASASPRGAGAAPALERLSADGAAADRGRGLRGARARARDDAGVDREGGRRRASGVFRLRDCEAARRRMTRRKIVAAGERGSTPAAAGSGSVAKPPGRARNPSAGVDRPSRRGAVGLPARAAVAAQRRRRFTPPPAVDHAARAVRPRPRLVDSPGCFSA